MNEHVGSDTAGLVPAGRRALTPATTANPLVSRGLSALNRVDVAILVEGELYSRPKGTARTGWWADWRLLAATPSVVRIDSGMDYQLRIEKPRGQDYLYQLDQLAGALPLWSLEIHKNRCPVSPALRTLAKYRSLRELMLNGWYTNMTDTDLASLATLHELQYLSLDGGSQISDDGLSQLRGLTELRELDLSYCLSITNRGLSHLHDFKRLQELKLDGCGRLTEVGISALQAALPQCTIRGWRGAGR